MRAFALYRRIMRFTMSDNTSFSQTLARLLQALDAASDAELARALGISRASMYEKMRKFSIKRPPDGF